LLAKDVYQARPGLFARRGTCPCQGGCIDRRRSDESASHHDYSRCDRDRCRQADAPVQCPPVPVVDTERRLVGFASRIDLLGVYDRTDAYITDEIMERVIAGDFLLTEPQLDAARGIHPLSRSAIAWCTGWSARFPASYRIPLAFSAHHLACLLPTVKGQAIPGPSAVGIGDP
jgi:hypothetical protein